MVEKGLYDKSIYVRQLAFVLGAPETVELNAGKLSRYYMIDRAIGAIILSQGTAGYTIPGILIHMGNVKEKESIIVDRIKILEAKGVLGYAWLFGFKRFFISTEMSKMIDEMKKRSSNDDRLGELGLPEWLVNRVQIAQGYKIDGNQGSY